MVLRFAKGAAALAGLTSIAAMSNPAESQQAKAQGDARARADAERAKAKAADAGARSAEAQAKAAAADAAARQSEALARSELAKAEASREEARLKAESERRAQEIAAEEKRRADERAAEEAKAARAKEQRDFEAKQGNAQTTLITMGVTAAALAVGAYVGSRLGLGAVKKAASAAQDVVKSVEALGKTAATLVKSKGQIAGTVKGDQLQAVVNEAYALGKVKSAFASPGYQAKAKTPELFGALGKPDATAFVVPAVNVAHGAASVYASGQVEDKSVSLALRAEGVAAITAGLIGGKMLIAARGGSVRPSSQAIANIEAGRARLIREGMKPGGQVPKVKAAQPRKPSPQPKPEPVAAPSPRPRMRPANTNGGGTETFSRTYKTGPKAGVTETVTVRR